MTTETGTKTAGTTRFDVVVVGGGAAGLNAALVLGRARRSVLVIDAGEPRNAPAEGVHGYLGLEGVAPSELLATGRAEVRSYGGEFVDGRATDARRTEGDFAVTLDDSSTVHGRRLLLTTGLVDVLPDVAGLRERWGRDVIHCPYCHGWEVRDQRIGVLGSGPMSTHQALLFSQWTADVTYFVHTAPEPTNDEWEQLAARGVSVVTGEVASLEVEDDRLTGVRLATGTRVPVDALAVATRMVARTDLLASLGLELTDHPMGGFVTADPLGLTAVPGVYAAGNVSDLSAQVIVSAAAGLRAGAGINADLLHEDIEHAVAERAQAATA